ncbi:MAG TPA: hypothetical protein VFB06_32170 [Streptosporangiaceae bacterium]|nr:hypothetical protein [Streptosporangiaceae bacterium]
MTALIPFYAIGVFTGFSMAGFGMARYHGRTKEPGWRYKRVINTAGGIYTALVVVLFAVVKFTEGAWLIVILFPALVWVLIRLNREYRTEAAALEDSGAIVPNYTRQVILVLIDGYDMAVAAAVRYAKSQRPTALRAVHFVLDDGHAERLRDRWVAARTGVPLELADCPDRRLAHAAAEHAAREAAADGTFVTVVLPRRSYPPLAGRVLHDRTADRIAHVVSRVPGAAATIVPCDVRHHVGRHASSDAPAPPPPPGADPIGSLAPAT